MTLPWHDQSWLCYDLKGWPLHKRVIFKTWKRNAHEQLRMIIYDNVMTNDPMHDHIMIMIRSWHNPDTTKNWKWLGYTMTVEWVCYAKDMTTEPWSSHSHFMVIPLSCYCNVIYESSDYHSIVVIYSCHCYDIPILLSYDYHGHGVIKSLSSHI